MTLAGNAQHLRKVQRDLADCSHVLQTWYDHPDSVAGAVDLHIAAEALMRAVATLAQVVEDQQP